MKSYTFKIYKFNAATKKIEMTAKLKTKPVNRDRLEEIIKLELMKFGSSVCYEIAGEL